jgi:phosphoribosylamine---glycine ligase
MRILVVGGGAREHALVWKLTGERAVTEVVCAPGNPGIVRLARCLPLDLTDPAVALALAARELIDLTIVGPELPLDRGIADRFAAERRPLVGPTRAAARLECSKAFAKNFMSRHRVPTAAYRICDTFAEVIAVLDEERFGYPLVLKADGLAAGKGVVIAGDRAEAEEAARAALLEGRFGDAGRPLVVEECLQGPEISFFVLCDGRRALPLGSAQDHKRLGDGDTGPNTGGMGAFAPSPIWSPELERQVMREVIEPVLGGLAAEGSPYRGFLYVGLMLTAAGPRVIEFNVRLGDPEAQVLLPLLAGDLAPALLGAATGELPAQPLGLGSEPHVGVVVASAGYPGGVGAARPPVRP